MLRVSRRYKYGLLLPALAILAATTIFPVVFALNVSLQDWRLTRSAEPLGYVGLDNYSRILGDANFWNSVMNTVIYIVVVGVLSLGIGFGAALLLQRVTRFNNFMKSLLIFPFAVALILRGYSFRFMLTEGFGVIDVIIDTLAPPLSSTIWLAEPGWALLWMGVPEMWAWAALSALMFLGALNQLPGEVTEAAMVDGASRGRIIWSVILPQLRPFILVVVLLKVIFSIRMFDLVQVMTGGGPGRSTQTLNYYIYQNGFVFFDMGYASALAIVMTVGMVLIALLYARVLERSRI